MVSFEYFIVLAEELNFTRAAKRLGISQSSLSEYLRRLETELGAELLIRKPSLALTAAGQCAATYGKRILGIYEETEEQIRALSGNGRHLPFRIGIVAPLITAQSRLIPLDKLRRVFPATEFSTCELYPANGAHDRQTYLQDARENNCNVVICPFSQGNAPETKNYYLSSSPQYLLISRNLFLQHFTENDIERFRFGVDILDFWPIPHIAISTDGVIARQFRAYYNDHARTYKPLAVISDMAASIDCTRDGLGWSTIGSNYLQGAGSPDILAFPINSPSVTFHNYLLINESLPVDEQIIRYIVRYLRTDRSGADTTFSDNSFENN